MVKAKAAATSEQLVNGCMEVDNINRHPRVVPQKCTPLDITTVTATDTVRHRQNSVGNIHGHTVACIEKPKSVALSANSNQSVPRCPTRKKKATPTPETDSYPIHSDHAPDNNPQYLDEKRATLQAWDLELKAREKVMGTRERAVKQHEREVLEQSQQIATMKSLITKMEEDVRGLKEENRMLRLRTNKELPARSTACKTDTQVHTTAVHDMELRLLGRLIEVQKDVEYLKDCRKADHVDYVMDNIIYQAGKYPHSGLGKHAERTRPSRERYSPQKTSKWKSGVDRRNTSCETTKQHHSSSSFYAGPAPQIGGCSIKPDDYHRNT